MMRSKRKRNRDDKFRPTDLEVIQRFLDPKVQGKVVDGEGDLIVEHNIYAARPESLNWNPVPRLPDNERLYFVKRKPLSRLLANAKNAVRTLETGEGHWKKSRKYEIKEGTTIKGYYDLMTFWIYEGNSEDKKRQKSVRVDHFLMHEFYLPGSTLEDWVVCLVKYKVGKKQQVMMIPHAPAITPLPPEVVQPPAINPLPPEAVQCLLQVQQWMEEEIEDVGSWNIDESLLLLLQPQPDDDPQSMLLSPPPKEAIILEDCSSTITTMEVDEGQEEEVSSVVSQREDELDWLLQLLDSDNEPYTTTSMAAKSEEHQQQQEEARVMYGYELFCRAPPPMPRHLVFEKSIVSFRKNWFDMDLEIS